MPCWDKPAFHFFGKQPKCMNYQAGGQVSSARCDRDAAATGVKVSAHGPGAGHGMPFRIGKAVGSK